MIFLWFFTESVCVDFSYFLFFLKILTFFLSFYTFNFYEFNYHVINISFILYIFHLRRSVSLMNFTPEHLQKYLQIPFLS